jgi:hypothetical protein
MQTVPDARWRAGCDRAADREERWYPYREQKDLQGYTFTRAAVAIGCVLLVRLKLVLHR